jgi:hypothetical protein
MPTIIGRISRPEGPDVASAQELKIFSDRERSPCGQKTTSVFVQLKKNEYGSFQYDFYRETYSSRKIFTFGALAAFFKTFFKCFQFCFTKELKGVLHEAGLRHFSRFIEKGTVILPDPF